MSGLMIFAIGLAAFWALAFIGAPLLVWTAAIGAGLIGLVAAGVLGSLGATIAAAIFVPLAALLNIRSLRSSVLTRPIFAAFKRVLPEMSSTEREALEAGDVWWEAEMFRGRPDWSKLIEFKNTTLTAEEQAFIDGPVDQLCEMLDEWKIVQEDKDLPEEVWQFLRDHKFFAMLIAKEHGGLGFSALAQSTVVTRIATRSLTAAVTVMVPNSLGPGELLMHYGTPEQQKQWLPGLCDGTELPCFGLTGVDVGSDASGLTDKAVVCKSEWEGKEVLGMKLSFSKRYITLAPVATVVGLAVKLQDPEGLLGDADKSEYGITCVLLPASTPGVKIGRRHYPGSAFMNGPIEGEEVFVPIDWIIGGPEMAGKGWRMLVECLSAGRGISLPALAASAGKMMYRMTGAYGRIRRQFKMPIGKFEGVQEASGRIAGLAYTLEAMRTLTASAVDNCAPSVVTAMAKYHMTEMMRTVITDAMDIHGGRGVMNGPRNYMQAGYAATPVAITVEGANILTRNLMIFGQGAIRCHPFVFPEMEAARKDDLTEFDQLLFGHIGFSVNRGVRALTLGLTGARLAKSPVSGPMAKYFRQLERMSSSLAFVSDVTMGMLGGELKRKERLSARLGDVMSQLYIASAVLKYYLDNGQKADDRAYAEWAVQHCLAEIDKAFDGFFANFPVGFVGSFLRRMVFPLGRSYLAPSDKLTSTLAEHMMEPSELRNRLTAECFLGGGASNAIIQMEDAFKQLIAVEPYYNKFSRAVAKGEITAEGFEAQLAQATELGIVTETEARALATYEPLRLEAIYVDDFSKEYLKGISFGEPEAQQANAA